MVFTFMLYAYVPLMEDLYPRKAPQKTNGLLAVCWGLKIPWKYAKCLAMWNIEKLKIVIAPKFVWRTTSETFMVKAVFSPNKSFQDIFQTPILNGSWSTLKQVKNLNIRKSKSYYISIYVIRTTFFICLHRAMFL